MYIRDNYNEVTPGMYTGGQVDRLTFGHDYLRYDINALLPQVTDARNVIANDRARAQAHYYVQNFGREPHIRYQTHIRDGREIRVPIRTGVNWYDEMYNPAGAQVARQTQETERADVTAIEERTENAKAEGPLVPINETAPGTDDHGFTEPAPAREDNDEAGAEATGEVAAAPAKIDWKIRLRNIVDDANTNWPLTIEGPNGEGYVSALMLRSILLAAQAEMGWCDPGANEALRRMKQPELNVTGNQTNLRREFIINVTLTDEMAAGGQTVRHELQTREQIHRHIESGLRAYSRQNGQNDNQRWTVEMGERRTAVRRVVTFEGDEEVEAHEVTRNFQPVTMHIWVATRNVSNEATQADRNTAVQLAWQTLCYERTYSVDGVVNYRDVIGVGTGHWDVEMVPVPQPEGGHVNEMPISDHELRDEYVRVSGRRRSTLRGHG